MEWLRWRELSLARQFALAGGVVMLVAMLSVGLWVSPGSRRIRPAACFRSREPR